MATCGGHGSPYSACSFSAFSAIFPRYVVHSSSAFIRVHLRFQGVLWWETTPWDLQGDYTRGSGKSDESHAMVLQTPRFRLGCRRAAVSWCRRVQKEVESAEFILRLTVGYCSRPRALGSTPQTQKHLRFAGFSKVALSRVSRPGARFFGS